MLQGGETSITDRLPFLQKGLLAQLAEATHGIGVILEHRYYGTSFPTPDLSTENLRFLTTEQALADEVFFAQNVVFKGLEDKDLTSDSVAYIGYGGSYAGAFNAFLRKLYPDIFWGNYFMISLPLESSTIDFQTRYNFLKRCHRGYIRLLAILGTNPTIRATVMHHIHSEADTCGRQYPHRHQRNVHNLGIESCFWSSERDLR